MARNGINMLDVKIRNRRSILELVYRTRKIPRKDIAKALGLTPAAITLITTDLIDEGILVETAKRESNARGRREVLLEINSEKFCVIGINITRHHFELICTDLNTRVLYHNRFKTIEEDHDPKRILNHIAEAIEADILSSSVLGKKTLLSIGVSTLGIVNTEEGISVNSYGVFNGQVHIADFLQERFSVPVIVTNNICANAHGEAFLKNSSMQTGSLLFIKYGPGIGSSLLKSDDRFNIYAYEAVQLAHVISDPNGRPCICGNHGCLETIVSYSNVISELYGLISPDTTPELYQAWHDIHPFSRQFLDDSGEEMMEDVFRAFDQGNPVVTQEMRRVLFHMGTAIKNAITLLNPDSVILYGEAFEHRKFRDAIMSELSLFTKSQKVSFSEFNMKLDVMGPATTAISLFFLSGGHIPEKRAGEK